MSSRLFYLFSSEALTDDFGIAIDKQISSSLIISRRVDASNNVFGAIGPVDYLNKKKKQDKKLGPRITASHNYDSTSPWPNLY